jgi:hypothetical protein
VRAAKLREQQATAGAAKPPSSAKGCEKRASSLTPRRLKFALAWAEADPEDRLQDIAMRAGYSESVAKSGMVADLCRDEEIIKLRDQRLLELQQAAGVTVEETLVGLAEIARDPKVLPKDRVAARKILLAWYARDKGQHQPMATAPSAPASTPSARGLDREARRTFELELLGIELDAGEDIAAND